MYVARYTTSYSSLLIACERHLISACHLSTKVERRGKSMYLCIIYNLLNMLCPKVRYIYLLAYRWNLNDGGKFSLSSVALSKGYTPPLIHRSSYVFSIVRNYLIIQRLISNHSITCSSSSSVSLNNSLRRSTTSWLTNNIATSTSSYLYTLSSAK